MLQNKTNATDFTSLSNVCIVMFSRDEFDIERFLEREVVFNLINKLKKKLSFFFLSFKRLKQSFYCSILK
jgi:hypothetical protein